MRRALFVLVVVVLVGCGGSVAPTATPVTPPATASVTNTAATATRDVELAQLATQQAQSVQIATLSAVLNAPSATPAVIATPTPLAPSPTDIPPTPIPATDTPVPAATALPTFIALPTTSGGEVVTVLNDGTGQSVNLRILPSTTANIVRQAKAGDNLDLSSTTPVNAEGATWWQLVSDHGGVVYVRADLVSAPHVPLRATATPFPARFDPSFTNVTRGTQPDLIFWAVPQSYGGYTRTKCDAHYINRGSIYTGTVSCFTAFFNSMESLAVDVHQEQQRGIGVVFLAIPPDPPRVYLLNTFTAIAWSDNGLYLAQGPDDKTAITRARAIAQQFCGISCTVNVDYYYQS